MFSEVGPAYMPKAFSILCFVAIIDLTSQQNSPNINLEDCRSTSALGPSREISVVALSVRSCRRIGRNRCRDWLIGYGPRLIDCLALSKTISLHGVRFELPVRRCGKEKIRSISDHRFVLACCLNANVTCCVTSNSETLWPLVRIRLVRLWNGQLSSVVGDVRGWVCRHH